MFVGISECKFQTGACFSFQFNPPKKENDMGLPAGFPPPVVKSSKAVKAVQVMPDMAEPVPEVVQPLPVAVPAAVPPSVPLPGAVGVPAIPGAGAFGELGQLPAAGNISPLTIVLALVAVGGGGAAWKFYSQRSKEKHEEAMLKIEKNADSDASKNDQQRQKCDTAAQWAKEQVEHVSARLDASDKNLAAIADSLDKRLADLEQKASDLGELENRLAVLEKKSVSSEKKASERKSKGVAK
jgi:hypothetical protein